MAHGTEKTRSPLTVVFGVAVFLFYGLTESGWERHAPLVSSVLYASGIFLVGAASLGRMWCSLFIAGYKTRALVTEGPYSMSRNPLYFFSFLGFAGIGLCTETLLFPAVLLSGFALYFPRVIRGEEARLLEEHGEAYRAYAAATPRFFPRFSALREPAEYLVNPRIFRKNLPDALLFIWVAGLLEVAEALHHLGWLPVLLTVY